MNRREIRAVYTGDTIRVYQAYSPVIAEEAVAGGRFGPHFSLKRMTWIKPSFLWMMYRCGWAQKPGQERVLAIDLRRDAFDEVVRRAVPSSYRPELGISREAWQQAVARSDIRCQWDPERDIQGNPLPFRSIQLGLRGAAVRSYVDEWIVQLSDITAYVEQLRLQKEAGAPVDSLLPQERSYPMPEEDAE